MFGYVSEVDVKLHRLSNENGKKKTDFVLVLKYFVNKSYLRNAFIYAPPNISGNISKTLGNKVHFWNIVFRLYCNFWHGVIVKAASILCTGILFLC